LAGILEALTIVLGGNSRFSFFGVRRDFFLNFGCCSSVSCQWDRRALDDHPWRPVQKAGRQRESIYLLRAGAFYFLILRRARLFRLRLCSRWLSGVSQSVPRSPQR